MAPSDSECWISRDDLKKKKRTVNSVSPYVRESKSVLDSGFHTMDSGFFVTGTLIPDSDRQWDPDSLRCISDSKDQDSWICKQNISRIPLPEAKSIS